MPGALAAGLMAAGSAVASLLGTAASNAANANLNKKNMEWQEKMWNKTNEYNLPINVMQRYKDAGLNPNLVYGNLNQASATLPSSPHLEGALDYGQAFRGLGNSIYDNILAQQQTEANVKVAETQANLNTTNQKKAEEEANNVIADTAHKQLDNIFLSKTMEQRIDSEVQKLELLKKNNLISDAQYKQELEKINIFKQQVREASANADKAEEEVKTQTAVTANVKADTLLKDAQRAEAYSSAALNKAKIQTEKMQQKYLASGASLNYANVQVANAYAGKLVQETKNLKLDAIKTYCEVLKTPAIIKKMQAETNFTYTQCTKMINEIYQSAQNNALDRYLKSFPQRYGTSEAGVALGFIYEVVHGLVGGGNTLYDDSFPVVIK